MKKKLVFVLVLVLLALALPVSNLLAGLPQSKALASIETEDALYKEALAILGSKCANCHTADYMLPFYAKVPPAKGIVEKDIALGTEYLDLPKALAAGPVPGEVLLAKLEYSIAAGTMPPGRYLALHWDGGLTQSERDTLVRWIQTTRAAHYAPEGLADSVATTVLHPIPAEHGQDMMKVALGEKLYFDKRLSGDDTLSCASCHALEKGGTDQAPVSTGINGQLGPINSPTVYNSRWNLAQFWDGRAADLQEQAAGPVENPIEMGAKWEDVIAKLNQDTALATAFQAVYPAGLSVDTVTDAIAEFERTLITPNSAFDRYLMGQEDALSAEALAGFHAFVDNGCAMCHVGKALGGQSFEKMGRKGDYFGDRGNLTEVDAGRFNLTKDEADRGFFKVPVLRNIAVTFPYFHDASAETLEAAVTSMAKYQMGITLSGTDTANIVAFLESLTGVYDGTLLTEMQ